MPLTENIGRTDLEAAVKALIVELHAEGHDDAGLKLNSFYTAWRETDYEVRRAVVRSLDLLRAAFNEGRAALDD